jgi:hypothetical protein
MLSRLDILLDDNATSQEFNLRTNGWRHSGRTMSQRKS